MAHTVTRRLLAAAAQRRRVLPGGVLAADMHPRVLPLGGRVRRRARSPRAHGVELRQRHPLQARLRVRRVGAPCGLYQARWLGQQRADSTRPELEQKREPALQGRRLAHGA